MCQINSSYKVQGEFLQYLFCVGSSPTQKYSVCYMQEKFLHQGSTTYTVQEKFLHRCLGKGFCSPSSFMEHLRIYVAMQSSIDMVNTYE